MSYTWLPAPGTQGQLKPDEIIKESLDEEKNDQACVAACHFATEAVLPPFHVPGFRA